MELQQIRYVVALAQELNFLKASKKVHVSQPTLSQQVKKLEEELGAPLFERSSKYVRLTPQGEKFLPYAISVLESLKKGADDLREDSVEISGRVRLSAIPTIGPYVLPDVVRVLRQEAPRLVLELYEETTSLLLQRLKEGHTDLGLLALPVEEPAVACKAIGEEEFFLAAAASHPLAEKKTVRTKDLKDQDLLILQEGHCFGSQSLEYCRRSRADKQVIFQGSSLTSVMKLAAAGEGVTLVPFLAADAKANPGLRFIPFEKPKPSRILALVWRMASPLNRSQKFIMDLIEKTVYSQKDQKARKR